MDLEKLEKKEEVEKIEEKKPEERIETPETLGEFGQKVTENIRETSKETIESGNQIIESAISSFKGGPEDIEKGKEVVSGVHKEIETLSEESQDKVKEALGEKPEERPSELIETPNVRKLESISNNLEFKRLLPGYVEYMKSEPVAKEPLIHGTGSYALKRIIKEGFVPQRGGEILHGEKVAHHTNVKKEQINPISFTTPDADGEKVAHWYAMLAAKEPQLSFNSDKILNNRTERILNEVYGGMNEVIEVAVEKEMELLADQKDNLNMSEVKEIARKELRKDIEQKLIDRGKKGANVFNPELAQERIQQLNDLLSGRASSVEEVESVLRDLTLLENFMYSYASGGSKLPKYKTREVVEKVIDDLHNKPRNSENRAYRKLSNALEAWKGKIEKYEKLPEEERKKIDNQFPCFIVLEGKEIKDKLVDKSEWMRNRIKELQGYENISPDKIKEIQVPESKIDEVKEWLRESGLDGVRVVPFEYHEMKEVIQHLKGKSV